MVIKEPDTTSKEIQAELQAQNASVSAHTILHCLNNSTLNIRRPRRTPLFKANHKKERLEFAEMHIDTAHCFWKDVFWTHKTK